MGHQTSARLIDTEWSFVTWVVPTRIGWVVGASRGRGTAPSSRLTRSGQQIQRSSPGGDDDAPLRSLDWAEFGQEQERNSQGADRRQEQRLRCRRSRKFDVPGRKQVRRDRPVGQTAHCGGALIGDEVPECREEAPQLRPVLRDSTTRTNSSSRLRLGSRKRPWGIFGVRSQANNAEANM